jgi:hypothetical protein
MKTKLTLNIDAAVIEKAKRNASAKNRSLSAIVEEYLYKFSNGNSLKSSMRKKKTITQRIKELTKSVQISDNDLKKAWHKHLDEKYGK